MILKKSRNYTKWKCRTLNFHIQCCYILIWSARLQTVFIMRLVDGGSSDLKWSYTGWHAGQLWKQRSRIEKLQKRASLCLLSEVAVKLVRMSSETLYCEMLRLWVRKRTHFCERRWCQGTRPSVQGRLMPRRIVRSQLQSTATTVVEGRTLREPSDQKVSYTWTTRYFERDLCRWDVGSRFEFVRYRTTLKEINASKH